MYQNDDESYWDTQIYNDEYDPRAQPVHPQFDPRPKRRKDGTCCFLFSARTGVYSVLVLWILFAVWQSVQACLTDMVIERYDIMEALAFSWISVVIALVGIFSPQGVCLIIWALSIVIGVVYEIKPWRVLDKTDDSYMIGIDVVLFVISLYGAYVVNAFRGSMYRY